MYRYLNGAILSLALIGNQWTVTFALGVVAVSLAVRFISYIVVGKHGAIVGSMLTAMRQRRF